MAADEGVLSLLAGVGARMDEQHKAVMDRLQDLEAWTEGHDQRHIRELREAGAQSAQMAEKASERDVRIESRLTTIETKVSAASSPVAQAERLSKIEGRVDIHALIFKGLGFITGGSALVVFGKIAESFAAHPK